jgi:hypothetical protein
VMFLSIYYIIKTTNNQRLRLNIVKPMDQISQTYCIHIHGKNETYARTENKMRRTRSGSLHTNIKEEAYTTRMA